MKNGIIFLFLFVASSVWCQPTQYFKDSEMNGFPLLVKQLGDYEKVKSNFDYFKLDAATYNSLFYKSYVTEGSSNASFYRMDITMSRKLTIEPTLFPNYKVVLNPKLEKGYFSKQRLTISIREQSVSAFFTTDFIGLIFPNNILQTKDNQPVEALINTTSVEYHNDGNLNKFHGLLVKGTTGFTIKPSIIPGSFIDLSDFKGSEIKFLSEEAYEFPFLVFENTQLANFISNYKKANKNANVKSPEKYKASILIKNIKGKANFPKAINCDISEIYFFENVIAGVIDFPLNKKKALVAEINSLNRVINRGPLKLKSNGDFPTLIDFYSQTYYKIEEDSKSVKMYFIIVK